MGQFAHLLGKRPSPRKPQPYDRFTKAALWARLQAAERQLADARRKAQRAAAMAHNAAQGAEGEVRRQFIGVRDAAYQARDAAEGEG